MVGGGDRLDDSGAVTVAVTGGAELTTVTGGAVTVAVGTLPVCPAPHAVTSTAEMATMAAPATRVTLRIAVSVSLN